MLRIFLQYILPIGLPTALYALWLLWQQKRAAASGARVPQWEEGPWFWLLAAGLALSFAAFVVTALLWGNAPGAEYTPAEIKGGQMVPGRFKE